MGDSDLQERDGDTEVQERDGDTEVQERGGDTGARRGREGRSIFVFINLFFDVLASRQGKPTTRLLSACQ